MNPLRLIKAQFRIVARFTPAECAARVRAGEAVLIDVREPKEWTAGVADRAVLLSLADLTGKRVRWKPFLATHDGRELLLYCGAGVRSAMAAKILAAEGFKTANAGGFPEWVAAGWPIVPSPAAHGEHAERANRGPTIPVRNHNRRDKFTMKTNIGSIDRTIRLIAALGIFGAGYYFKSWWGLAGLLPLLTAFVRFCPAYVPFGISTCATDKK